MIDPRFALEKLTQDGQVNTTNKNYMLNKNHYMSLSHYNINLSQFQHLLYTRLLSPQVHNHGRKSTKEYKIITV